MKSPVIAIGLDAANPFVLERWMNRGLLPNMQRLRKQGGFGKLTSAIKHNRAEVPWPVFLTGCLANKTGYWTPIKYHPDQYRCDDPKHHEGAYDFKKYPPFYAGLGSDFPVAVFDMPQTVLRDDLDGVQVLGWGGHARMTPSESKPAELYEELVDKYGDNPLLDRDALAEHDPRDEQRYTQGIDTGIARKADIVIDLLKRRKWSLLLTIFGEAHSTHHYLWHRSQPHTVDWSEAPASDDPLLRAFQAMDAAIGRIAEAAPQDSTIVIFSVHGTLSNSGDLGANVFLPEMMYRWNYPGQYALGPGQPDGLPLPKPRLANQTSWWNEVWNARYEPNKVKFTLRQRVPQKYFHKLRLERLSGRQSETPLLYKPDLFWLPASWYSGMWPKMRAFALPSYSDGYIRINLKGREANGVVEPEDYNRTCDEITEMLMSIRDARKGERLVEEVIRTRKGPQDVGPEFPEADLVVLFNERDCPADTVDHPTLGRIGPMPFNRTGGHFSTGFMIAHGPGIAAQSLISGDAIDVTPTLLQMMGAPIPEYMDGRPLTISQSASQEQASAAE